MANIHKLISHADGTLLLNHSFDVETRSKQLFDIYLADIQYEALRIASLLHDIGKCMSTFQKYISNVNNKDNESFDDYFHNEYGGEFLAKHLNINGNFPLKKMVCRLVTYHHGISYGDRDDIYSKISDVDKNTMKEFIIAVLGEGYYTDIPDFDFSNGLIPFYVNTSNNLNVTVNEEFTTLRYILVSADRQCSSKREIDNTEFEVYDFSRITNNLSSVVNIDRLQEQYDISKKIKTGITAPKVPTGGGKTMIMLLYALMNKKRTIIVAPRNEVVKNIYTTIIENCEMLNINVPIFLLESNKLTRNGDFNSTVLDDIRNARIIIMNCDNYMSPTVDDIYSMYLDIFLTSDIFFDEFHEYFQSKSSALLKVFDHIVRLRLNFIKSCATVLLSATPDVAPYLYETAKKKITMLPNNYDHYKAIHSKPYNFSKILDFNNIPDVSSSLIKHNAVQNTTLFCKYYDNKFKDENRYITHSHYTDIDKEKHLKEVLNVYGDKNNSELNKPNVFSARILEASLNISFRNIYMQLFTLNSAFQTIGRGNRFGNYEECDVKYCYEHDSSEKYMRDSMLADDIFYWICVNLFDSFENHSYTLDELYNEYNKICNLNKNKLLDGHRLAINESANLFFDLTPNRKRKVFSEKTKKTNKKIVESKLRSDGKTYQVYVTCQDSNGDYCDSIRINIYGTAKKYLDIEDSELRDDIKSTQLLNDKRFLFGKFKKMKTKRLLLEEKFGRCGKLGQTEELPIPVRSRKYSERYGITKI